MKVLTDTKVKAELRMKRAGQVDLPDGTVRGLILRLSKETATWCFRYRVPGEGGVTARGHQRKGGRHRITLGTYPAKSIKAARAEAAAHVRAIEKGEVPATALEAAATAGGLTVAALSEKFLRDYVRSKKLRSARKYEQTIKVHIVPRLGTVIAATLTRERVRAFMREVQQRRGADEGRAREQGGDEAARTALGVLHSMLQWAIREEVLKLDRNPVSRMADNLPKRRKKDRALSLDEARVAWRTAASVGYAFGTHAQLMLLTGCRPGEWANAVWNWVDLKQALLVIPAEAYKADHVHVVPLVPRAVAILKSIPRSGQYVLSSTDGRMPVKGIGKFYKQRLPREIIAHTGEALAHPFTAHDLRRTVATRVAETLGIGGEQLVKKVLGHSDGTVTAVYNRYGYVKEMRAALEEWAKELTK
jgi:integrase